MESIADDHRKEITPQGKNRGSRSPVPDLLEEAWFFRKLIDGTTAAAAATTKKKPAVRSMGRCLSDLTSTQTVSLPPSPPLPPTPPGGLPRAPSLPPSGGCCRKSSRRNRGGDERKRVRRSERSSPGSDGGGVWGGRNPGSLERAPSLPPWIGREEAEEVVDDESDMSMSWLIQQAMSCSLDDISIPKSTAASPKVSRITHSSSMNSETRDGTSNRRRIPESNDRFNFNNINNNNNQSTVMNNNNSNRNAVVHGRRLNKTLSNLEIPRQQKQNAAAAYSYYYQSRRPNSDRSSPSIPPWASTANETDDIKAHLKVWARSVAANIN